MKCKLCQSDVGKTFLEKILGTYVKDSSGKRHVVCSTCQRELTQEEISTKLG